MQVFSCSHIQEGAGEPFTTVRVKIDPGISESEGERIAIRRDWIEADVRLCMICTASARMQLDQMGKVTW